MSDNTDLVREVAELRVRIEELERIISPCEWCFNTGTFAPNGGMGCGPYLPCPKGCAEGESCFEAEERIRNTIRSRNGRAEK